MYKAVIFDMDGVLLDTERVMKIGWERAGREMKFKRCRLAGDMAMGRNSEGVKELFKNEFPEVNYEEFHKRYHLYVKEILDKEGIPVKTGVLETLEIIKLRKMKISVATSTSSEHAIAQLKEAKIFPYADSIFTGDTVEKGKPDPEIYIKACKSVGVDPKEAFAVEDSPNGIESAYRAGMKAIFIPDLATMPETHKKYIYKTFPSMTAFGNYISRI